MFGATDASINITEEEHEYNDKKGIVSDENREIKGRNGYDTERDQ